ncbi:MAG: Asp-tRNA(Asn)/Glu-tRNA(Gln) amidotransferase subunit GatA [Spirochaetaceae bacterium]|nr:MAG: Asp-tRNA(Asn)/Glu-tRNA(Gln) amidotransferase subunit GatA [Spirochaetaceae bacterium]
MSHVYDEDREIRAFLQFDPELGRELAAVPTSSGFNQGGPLNGVPFAVKDNIAVRSFRLTCGSKLLKDLVSPYTATAVQKLLDRGAVPVGKTNLDEFGMGSSTENSGFGMTYNPWDLDRVPGGSSGGSAAAVAMGFVPFALGSDTGGSVRQPAAFCGVYGLKPTYGAVSRFGLVAYASSLEVIGIIAREPSVLREVFSTIRGQDPRDHTSIGYSEAKQTRKRSTVGVPELGSIPLREEVQSSWEKTLDGLKRIGFQLKQIELPALDYLVSAYYVIACAEASANLARFDGIRYGSRAAGFSGNPEKLVRLSRSRGLGDEVKLRILLGTYVLRSGFQDQYYLRAQRIRTAIRREFEGAFSGVDLVLMPVYPCGPFKWGSEGLDPFSQKLSDIFTCSANMAGLPALSFPASVENGLPIGMQFLGPPFAEERLLQACERYARVFPLPSCPLYRPPDSQGTRDSEGIPDPLDG